MSERDEINPMMPGIESGAIMPIPGQTLQRSGDQYCTAITVQKQRNLIQAMRKLEEEAAIAGDDFYFSWTVKGKDEHGNKGKKNVLVEGITIGCAMAMARYYGNCVVKAVLVEEKASYWLFNAIFIDLETGYTNNRLFRQNRSGGMGGKYNKDRADDMVFQTGQSKAVRNVIRATLPRVMGDRAMEVAKSNVMKMLDERIKNDTLPKVQEAAVAKLMQLGISIDAILERFQIADKKGLTKENLVSIMGDIKAITSGQEYPEVLYPEAEKEPEPSKSAHADQVMKELEAASPGTTATPEPEAKPEKKSKVKEKDIAPEPEPVPLPDEWQEVPPVTPEPVLEPSQPAEVWPKWCRDLEEKIMEMKDLSKTKIIAELIERHNQAAGDEIYHVENLLKRVVKRWIDISKGKVSVAELAKSNMEMMLRRMNDKSVVEELMEPLVANRKQY